MTKPHREVIQCFDVMFLNRISFLLSISRDIIFCTAETLKNIPDTTMVAMIRKIKMTYGRRGFIVNQAAADNGFISLEIELSGMGIALNFVAIDKHIPEVEIHVCTLKKRRHVAFNMLPFKKLPAKMLVDIVYTATFWICAIPSVDCVSMTTSPRKPVTGAALDTSKHYVIPFGAHVQTHEEHNSHMRTRTICAIALTPDGNLQGGTLPIRFADT